MKVVRFAFIGSVCPSKRVAGGGRSEQHDAAGAAFNARHSSLRIHHDAKSRGRGCEGRLKACRSGSLAAWLHAAEVRERRNAGSSGRSVQTAAGRPLPAKAGAKGGNKLIARKCRYLKSL